MLGKVPWGAVREWMTAIGTIGAAGFAGWAALKSGQAVTEMRADREAERRERMQADLRRMHETLSEMGSGLQLQDLYERKAEFAHVLAVSGWHGKLQECTAVADAERDPDKFRDRVGPATDELAREIGQAAQYLRFVPRSSRGVPRKFGR